MDDPFMKKLFWYSLSEIIPFRVFLMAGEISKARLADKLNQ
jgi:hypothetical protein